MRLIVGLTGASGAAIGVELLRRLAAIKTVETHLIITAGGAETLKEETTTDLEELKGLAEYVYGEAETGARIASGSYEAAGMAIVPCSMKTLAGIANGYSENLLLRAADVCIKEGRKLLLVPREMPFSRIHLRNMKELADCGAIIMPPVLTFYNTPKSIDAQINHIVNKILRIFGLPNNLEEWNGIRN